MPRKLLENKFELVDAEIDNNSAYTENALISNVRKLTVSGKTYQNLIDVGSLNPSHGYTIDKVNEIITYYEHNTANQFNMPLLKNNTSYTFICNVISVPSDIDTPIRINDTGNNYDLNILAFNPATPGLYKVKFTTRSGYGSLAMNFYSNTKNIGFSCNYPIILEGDHTNTDLPASINGIESVAEREVENGVYPLQITQSHNETDGIVLPNGVKNTIENGVHIQRVGKIVLDETLGYKTGGWGNQVETIGFEVEITTSAPYYFLKPVISSCFKYDRNFELDIENIQHVRLANGGTEFIRFRILRSKLETQDAAGVKLWLKDNPITVYYEITDLITEPCVVTEVNMPIPLRSLPNGTKDTIEDGKLIQRVNKTIIDGSDDENWVLNNGYLETGTRLNRNAKSNSSMISNYPVVNISYTQENKPYGTFITGEGKLRVVTVTTGNETDLSQAKARLQQNPLEVYYELETPIEHTINIPPISIAKGTNMVTTNNNIKPELTFKYKRKYKKSPTNNIKYLYNSGNEYSDITGGWRLTHQGSNTENYMVKNADNIQVYGVSGASGIEVGTTNKISWEDYDRICYEIEKIDVGDKGIFIINFVDTVGSTAWGNTQVTRGFDANTLGNTFTIKFEKPSGLSYTNGYIGIFTDHYWQQTSVCPMRFKIKKVWLEKSDTVVLYSNGNENKVLTGGYLTSSNNSATCNIEKQADNLYVNCTGKISFDSICYARTNKTIKPCKIKVSVKNNSMSANGIAFCVFLSEKEAITSVSEFNSVVNKKYIKASNTTLGEYIDLEMDLTDNTEGYFYVFCMTAGSADYTCKANINKIEIIR